MKKTLLLMTIIAFSLIPTAPALAQGDDPIPPACDPALILSDLQVMLEGVQNFEDFIEVMGVAGFVVFDCFDDWLTLLVDAVTREFSGGDVIPLPAPDDDEEPGAGAGSLTAADAEAALRAAFLGDVEQANQFVCPSQYLEEGQPFPENMVINEVSCQRLGDEMNCTFSVTSDELGGNLEDEVTFSIVNELLCTAVE